MRYLTAPVVGALLLLGCNAEFPEALDLAPADAAPADRGPSLRDMRPMDQAVDAAVDEGPPACEPEPERCDGIDNDCDNQADEGLGIGQQCAEGFGICRTMGLYACGPDGEVVCDREIIEPQQEICDRADNDCNGVVDDVVTVGELCSLEAAQTEGCVSMGVFECLEDNAQPLCNADPVDPDGDGHGCGEDCDETNAAVFPGAEEVCNLVDDDCDGAIDEGLLSCACNLVWRGPVGTGRRYLVCTSPAGWQGAREICGQYGSDLAVLDDEGEYTWLRGQAQRYTQVEVTWWMGLFDPDDQNRYRWITDRAPSWDNWTVAGPPPVQGPGYGLIDDRFGGVWSAQDSQFLSPFLCEDACVDEDLDGDGVDDCNADCDRTDRNIPGNEVCDPAGVDEDCDGEIDEGCRDNGDMDEGPDEGMD